MIGLLISIGIFLAYLLGVRFGLGSLPNSISASYYMLEKRHKNLGVLFTFFCWGTGLSLLPRLLDITPESFQFVIFIAVVSLCFVGAAPLFEDAFEGKVHRWSATLAMVGISTWIILMHWWVFLIAAIAYILGTFIYMATKPVYFVDMDFVDKVKPLFWLEVTLFVAAYLTAMIGG